MPEALWKQTQRRIAKSLGGSVTARTGYKGGDVETDWLVVEVKHRQKGPDWITQAVDHARAIAGESKLGIAVLHAKGERDDLVVLSLKDFKEWFGDFDGRANYDRAHEIVVALRKKKDALERGNA